MTTSEVDLTVRKICVINLKGGVGKTTTALNLAAGLSRSEKKVLLIDLDPQSNLELSMNLTCSWSVSDFLFEGVALSECINPIGANLDMVKGDEEILRSEHEDIDKMISRLRLIGGYDYVLFDCSPSMNTINKVALLYSNEVILPTTTDYLGFESVHKMKSFLETFNKYNDHDIKISKVVPTFFDVRNKICRNTLDELNNKFYQKMSSPIRVNAKLKEAPKNKASIFKYAPSSKGAADYMSLTQSVISDESLSKDDSYSEESASVAIEEE